MGGRSTSRIEAGHVQAMTEGKMTSLMRVLKDAPAKTVEKASTAEAVWPGAEYPTAEAKTAAGTVASSNAGIFSESNDVGSSGRTPVIISYRTPLKNVFWPNLFVGASFKILDIQHFASGYKLRPAAGVPAKPLGARPPQ